MVKTKPLLVEVAVALAVAAAIGDADDYSLAGAAFCGTVRWAPTLQARRYLNHKSQEMLTTTGKKAVCWRRRIDYDYSTPHFPY